jgi:hypothetical protein
MHHYLDVLDPGCYTRPNLHIIVAEEGKKIEIEKKKS